MNYTNGLGMQIHICECKECFMLGASQEVGISEDDE